MAKVVITPKEKNNISIPVNIISLNFNCDKFECFNSKSKMN